MSPTHRPGTRTVGNRFTALPMEGWDGTTDGGPTDLVRRRWRRFGRSGAKLIWGGEAVAVEPDGRANPNQLVISTPNRPRARRAARGARRGTPRCSRPHRRSAGRPAAHPLGPLEPPVRCAGSRGRLLRHPTLDARVGAGAESVFDDDELDRLVDRYVGGGGLAADAGFDFVDVKHCHGYLLHELLAGRDRPGRFGGERRGSASPS